MLTIIVTAIIIGALIGALARLIVPGPQAMGILLTIGIGIVGAVVGGLIGGALGFGAILTFLVEVGVAVLLVWLVAGRSRTTV